MTTQSTTTAEASGTWTLGDLPINRIGFGAMRLTGSVAFGPGIPADRTRSIEVLRQAIDLGVNHIDTAAFYFSPRLSANELINHALSPYPDDLVITTKVWPARTPSGDWWWATPDQLRGQVEENLRQLGRDHLDVVNLRVPPSRKSGSIAEHFGALADLRTEGLIRHLGVSNVTLAQLTEAQSIAPVVCVQNPFGIGAPPDQQELLHTCTAQDIAFVPFFAIAGAGAEGGATTPERKEVLTIAHAHNATPAQIKLAWTLHLAPNVLAIPGTGNPAHLTENIKAGTLHLSAEEMTHLTSLP